VVFMPRSSTLDAASMPSSMAAPVALSLPGLGLRSAGTKRRYWRPVRWLAYVVVALVVGNVSILAAHLWLQRSAPAAASVAAGSVRGINNFTVVDDHLWRGAAPSKAGYESLAAAGVTTVVDLRAEEGIVVDEERLRELGINRVHMPLRDGQSPTKPMVDRFLETVKSSDGRVYVHCGAGVGRTGTMAAAYLVDRGAASGLQAVRRNLSVGPPSLEQIAFAAGLRSGSVRRPPAALVAVSRVLDARARQLHLALTSSAG
jgi:protein-tyrosine phosphatase